MYEETQTETQPESKPPRSFRGWVIAILAVNVAIVAAVFLALRIDPDAKPAQAVVRVMQTQEQPTLDSLPPPDPVAPQDARPGESAKQADAQAAATPSQQPPAPPQRAPALLADEKIVPRKIPRPAAAASGSESAPVARLPEIASVSPAAALPSTLSKSPVIAMAPADSNGPVRVSADVAAGLVLKQVAPIPPADGVKKKGNGKVVLDAIISNTGLVENLRMISGQQELRQAAFNSAKKWRFKPYQINGQPVEIETQLTVVFPYTP